MIQWLRAIGMVRRDTAPELDLLGELFRTAAVRFTCPKCETVGLSAEPADADPEAADDEAWGMARKCDECGQPIPRERLEVFPGARLCTACQGRSDRGETSGDVEYCPKCGSVMMLRQAHRGVTRYVLSCPKCRS
jgi:predicted RNA-binding Zn-ribbon protein involved in translation (DUF1610 family)